MILSASRRTDIPAWYGAWFLNRLREGFALVPNPYAENLHMLRKIPLSPDVVDCIVFWSKNPRPFLDFLPEIQQLGYPFYFQFTLNPYEAAIEQNLPALDERIDTFHRLSAIIGPERIVWRYDPVIIDEAHPLNWHGEQFERLCALLHADTCRCVFSFFDRYAKDQSGFREVEEATMRAVARSFSSTAARRTPERVTSFCSTPPSERAVMTSVLTCVCTDTTSPYAPRTSMRRGLTVRQFRYSVWPSTCTAHAVDRKSVV